MSMVGTGVHLVLAIMRHNYLIQMRAKEQEEERRGIYTTPLNGSDNELNEKLECYNNNNNSNGIKSNHDNNFLNLFKIW